MKKQIISLLLALALVYPAAAWMQEAGETDDPTAIATVVSAPAPDILGEPVNGDGQPTEVPPNTPPEQGLLIAALELLIKAVTDITFVPIAAGFVTVAVGLIKRFVPARVSAGYIAITVQVVVWVVYVLALHFGYGDQFGSWVNTLTTILTAIAGLGASTLAASAVHDSAARRNVPVIGYKREDAG